MPLLRRPHGRHRGLRPRFRAQIPTARRRGGRDRYVMMSLPPPQHAMLAAIAAGLRPATSALVIRSPATAQTRLLTWRQAPFLWLHRGRCPGRPAADLRRKNLATDNASLQVLRRLRFGSKGPEAMALQQKLGAIQPDGDFGPETSRILHEQQRKANPNASDGIYSPNMDSGLGWSVFSAPLIS